MGINKCAVSEGQRELGNKQKLFFVKFYLKNENFWWLNDGNVIHLQTFFHMVMYIYIYDLWLFVYFFQPTFLLLELRGEGFLRIAVVLDRSGPLSARLRKSNFKDNYEEGWKSIYQQILIPRSTLIQFVWNPIMQRRVGWSTAWEAKLGWNLVSTKQCNSDSKCYCFPTPRYWWQ